MESDFVKFNLNSPIQVKITDIGFTLWKAAEDAYLPEVHRKPIEHYKEKADSEGYVTFQAWHFIQLFGEHTGMGVCEAYHPTVLINQKNLTPQQGASV